MDIGEISGFTTLFCMDINIRVYYFTPDIDIV